MYKVEVRLQLQSRVRVLVGGDGLFIVLCTTPLSRKVLVKYIDTYVFVFVYIMVMRILSKNLQIHLLPDVDRKKQKK